jgi:hypothetical protein
MADSRAVKTLDAARAALERALAWRPFVVGLALFAIAAAARLVLIGTSRFTGDEIVMWQTATRIAKGLEFPLLGPPITDGGARVPGPLFHYLMALPLLVTRAPEGCNAVIALLGAAAVVLQWSALRPYFGEAGAALAGLLTACMPWSTLYADRIWNANAISVFVGLAFWAACRLRRQPTLGGVVVLFTACAAMPQFHMSAPMVWLALIPIFAVSIRRWRWFWPLVASACALLLYVPMLVHELQSNWSNTRIFLSESAANDSDDWKRVPAWAFRMLTLDNSYQQMHSYWGRHTEGEMLEFLVKGNSDFTWTPLRWFLLGLSFAFALLAVGVSLWSAWKGIRARRPRPFFWAAVVGLAANTALLGFAHRPLYGHYIESLLPFYYVAFADLGRVAMGWSRAWLVVYGAALLVCVGGIDSALWLSRTLDTRNGLNTIRFVVDAIQKDRPGIRSASLRFGGFRAWDYGYNALLAADPNGHFSIGAGPTYRLVLKQDGAPVGMRLVGTTGPLALYGPR